MRTRHLEPKTGTICNDEQNPLVQPCQGVAVLTKKSGKAKYFTNNSVGNNLVGKNPSRKTGNAGIL